jgi:tetratricopeptide (TPR) repeat protein
MVTGTVTTNGLDKVVMSIAGEDEDYRSELVERITWGDVPPSYRDGRTYFDRGLFADAAAQFRLAAGDAGTRELVKADARLLAAESLLRWGASEPIHFSEAAEEAARFEKDNPSNRDLPRARVLHARASWLAGDTETAAEIYRAVYGEWQGDSGSPGYEREFCLEAGLQAARVLLAAKDTLGARELFTSIDATVGSALAGLEATDPASRRLTAIQDEALLGEGFAELAAGNFRQALTFFEGKVNPKANGNTRSGSDTLRFGATLGLGEALFEAGRVREAQMNFARVAALDHTDRDHSARALLRLAECTQKLVDPDYQANACAWCSTVVDQYGDTPWAAPARELKTKLNCK